MKNKGFLIGPHCDEASISQRLIEGDLLEEFSKQVQWFNPVLKQENENPQDFSEMDIFKVNTEALIAADYLIADLSTIDVNSAMQLGIAYGLQYSKAIIDEMFKNSDFELRQQINFIAQKHGIKNKTIYAFDTDVRKGKKDLHKYLTGGLECMNTHFSNSFKDCLDEHISDLKYNDYNAYLDLDDYFIDSEEEDTWQLTIEE